MAAFTALALGSLIAGTTLKVVGDIKAGNAAKRAGEAAHAAADSQAALLDWNAQVADLQAADAVARGAMEESRFREGVRVMIGSQRAGFAGSNVDVGFGSALDVQADAAYLGELDALTLRTNAAREAWGYQTQGADLRKRAEITRKEGVNVEEAGRQQQAGSRYSAAGTIAGAAGDASLLAQRYGFGKKP